MKFTQSLINDAADLIRPYNPTLAAMFINQPFQRMNLAKAFKAGFTKSVPDFCDLIIRVAELDRNYRASMQGR